MKSGRIRWTGYVACMGKKEYIGFSGHTQRNPHLEDLGTDGMGCCEHLSYDIKLENSNYPIFSLEMNIV
jgi:hypothetical protein